MLIHSFRTTFRHARRDAGYVLLNAGGLAVGLAACLVILMYVRTERSVDRFHENADRIVRVWSETTLGETPNYGSNSAHPLADLARERFPEVVAATRTMGTGTTLVASDQAKSYESDILFVEPSFHRIFDFDVQGNTPDAALGAPFSMVVTPSFASRFFGNADPVGQTLTMNFWGADYEFTVTGVVSPPGSKTRFTFSALASYATYEYVSSTAWTSLNPDTWFLLGSGVDWRALESRLQAAVTDVVGDGDDVWYAYFMQPLSDVHLGGLGLLVPPEGNPDTLRMFSGIAILILLIACANYMNLATARGAERGREVGVRKVFGAGLWQVRLHFLVEAAAMTLMAMLAAALLVELAVGEINRVAGTTLIDGSWMSGSIVLWILGIRGQMTYLADKDLGFEKENVMFIPVRSNSDRERLEEMAVQLSNVPGVVSAAVASNVPREITQGHGVRVIDERNDQGTIRRVLSATPEFEETLGLRMAAGTWFRKDRPADRKDRY